MLAFFTHDTDTVLNQYDASCHSDGYLWR